MYSLNTRTSVAFSSLCFSKMWLTLFCKSSVRASLKASCFAISRVFAFSSIFTRSSRLKSLSERASTSLLILASSSPEISGLLSAASTSALIASAFFLPTLTTEG